MPGNYPSHFFGCYKGQARGVPHACIHDKRHGQNRTQALCWAEGWGDSTLEVLSSHHCTAPVSALLSGPSRASSTPALTSSLFPVWLLSTPLGLGEYSTLYFISFGCLYAATSLTTTGWQEWSFRGCLVASQTLPHFILDKFDQVWQMFGW